MPSSCNRKPLVAEHFDEDVGAARRIDLKQREERSAKAGTFAISGSGVKVGGTGVVTAIRSFPLATTHLSYFGKLIPKGL